MNEWKIVLLELVECAWVRSSSSNELLFNLQFYEEFSSNFGELWSNWCGRKNHLKHRFRLSPQSKHFISRLSRVLCNWNIANQPWFNVKGFMVSLIYGKPSFASSLSISLPQITFQTSLNSHIIYIRKELSATLKFVFQINLRGCWGRGVPCGWITRFHIIDLKNDITLERKRFQCLESLI